MGTLRKEPIERDGNERGERTEGSLDELRETLREFDTVMLVTNGEDDMMHARPMALQNLDERLDCDLWLVTSMQTAKVHEIGRDRKCAVVALRSRDGAYVSIAATARCERDEAEVKRLWKPDWKAWFPKGPDDPQIGIVKLAVQRAEYWEPEGGRLRVLFSMAKSVLHGRPADADLNPVKEVSRS
jgi:general stress protein 26